MVRSAASQPSFSAAAARICDRAWRAESIIAGPALMVSRTVKALEERGLVSIVPETEQDRKRLACSITPAGQALHDQVIGTARRMQAEVICQLSARERDHFFRALARLQAFMDDEAEAEARIARGAGTASREGNADTPPGG